MQQQQSVPYGSSAYPSSPVKDLQGSTGQRKASLVLRPPCPGIRKGRYLLSLSGGMTPTAAPYIFPPATMTPPTLPRLRSKQATLLPRRGGDTRVPLLKHTSLLAPFLRTGRAGADHGGRRDGAGGRAVPRGVVALAAGDGAGAPPFRDRTEGGRRGERERARAKWTRESCLPARNRIVTGSHSSQKPHTLSP